MNRVSSSKVSRTSARVLRRIARSLFPHAVQNKAYAAQKENVEERLDRPRPAPQATVALVPNVAVAPVPKAAIAVDPEYDKWIEEHELGPEQLRSQADVAKELSYRPLISVIVPIFKPEHWMLKSCLESVLEQTYDCWELCVAFAANQETAENIELIRALASGDLRVKVVSLEQNHGISGNSNAALALATGEFVALLDHDDVLARFALFEVAKQLQLNPEADICYSDHDYLDEASGLRRDPLFKPDWSPEILFSANYITHLTVLRRRLVESIGAFHPDTDGAQDWDLFLRATERTSRVFHIPKVLYHWRMHSASTARNDSAKSYVANAQVLAIRGHMERIGIPAEPEIMPDGLLHVKFTEKPTGMVSIIIPTKDRLELLSRCVSTLLAKTSLENFEILIVDNRSREEATKAYLRRIERDPRIRVLWYPWHFNYSAVNNFAAREARGEYLLFLNNDIEITSPEWLSELVSWAAYKPIGVVGARLLRSNRLIQHAGVVLGLNGFADHPFADGPALTFGLAGGTGWYRNFLAVTGACMMLRREVFDELGGFDEKFLLCGSDVEICLRAHQQGYRILCNPFAELIHYEQQTRGADVPAEDYLESIKYYREWLIKGDPYWNPNLSAWSKTPVFRRRGEEASSAFARRFLDDLVQNKQDSQPVCSQPMNDEDRLAAMFDCSEETFKRLRTQAACDTGFHRVSKVLWFIPQFENAFYGGIFTILSFAAYWKEKKGVENFFAICENVNRSVMVERIRAVFPDLPEENVLIVRKMEDAAFLPSVDASICTLWTTAYYSANHTNVGRRFYFIQDFEPNFYRAGSASALVESTYRMGFYGIANTVSLKKMYESEYGGKAVHFTPSVNTNVFHPARDKRLNPEGPWQVFFYGRPSHPRNSFELLRCVMKQLKARLGDRVRIVCAGSDWKPEEYGLGGVVENLGMLAYDDTARLYRRCDAGVVLMLTRHPSYLPFEMMASKCLTVTNENAWTSWLLKDGENCLLTPATATAITDTIERGLCDYRLREAITDRAFEGVVSRHADWASEMEKVYRYLCDPNASVEADVSAAPEKHNVAYSR